MFKRIFPTKYLFLALSLSFWMGSAPASPVALDEAGPQSEGELVKINFPEPTDIRTIARAVATWTGKNIIFGKSVAGKIQIISSKMITKEEAYQAFLSALNVAGYTTVESGRFIKILPIVQANRSNLQVYPPSSIVPRTDAFVTHVIPLQYIQAKDVQAILSRFMRISSMGVYKPTNTLIVSDTGFNMRRLLSVIEQLDVKTAQPKVVLLPVRYGDAKVLAAQISELLDFGVIETPKAKAVVQKNPVPKGKQPAAIQKSVSKAQPKNYKVSFDERSNSLVVLGLPEVIEQSRALLAKFDVPLNDALDSSAVRVRFLDYTDAKKIASTLTTLVSSQAFRKAASPRVLRRSIGIPRPGSKNSNLDLGGLAALGSNFRITADEDSNALLIKGPLFAYQAINEVIRKLDRRRPQIYVEADILDMNVDKSMDIKTSVLLGAKKGSATNSFGWQGTDAAPLVLGDSLSSSEANKAAVAGALGSDFTVGILSGQTVEIPGIGPVSPAGLIKLAKADGRTRVLSSPHLLTSINEIAKITVGDTLFYKTAETSSVLTQGAVEKVAKESADLKLEIKSNINHSGRYVTMKVDIEANEGSLDPSTLVPKINKRSSSQIVTVRNGQTIVISGLMKNRLSETFQKVPLLGDIPLLGWLFRNSQEKRTKSNLTIFLTPHVIYGANDLARVYEQRRSEQESLMAKTYGLAKEDGFRLKSPEREDDVLPESKSETPPGKGA